MSKLTSKQTKMLHAKKDNATKTPKPIAEPTTKKILGKAKKRIAPKVPRAPKAAGY